MYTCSITVDAKIMLRQSNMPHSTLSRTMTTDNKNKNMEFYIQYFRLLRYSYN